MSRFLIVVKEADVDRANAYMTTLDPSEKKTFVVPLSDDGGANITHRWSSGIVDYYDRIDMPYAVHFGTWDLKGDIGYRDRLFNSLGLVPVDRGGPGGS
tara:strand:- start:62 stop:358 length:297 start_codon:yes stop_codon:yes gene_type:complete